MKYRIKIKEYNNGTKEYIVQKQKVKPFILYLTMVICPLFTLFVSNLDGNLSSLFVGLLCSILLLLFFIFMIMENNIDIETFCTMDGAKKFIDKQIEEQVKSTTYLKYP